MRVWMNRASVLVWVGLVAGGCESAEPQAPIACESDRACADGDPCNGVERCESGWCVAQPAGCVDATQCSGSGECLAPCTGDCGVPAACAVASVPVVRTVPGDRPIPVTRWSPDSTGVEVEVSLSAVGEAPSQWQALDGDAFELASLGYEADHSPSHLRIHLRTHTPDASCEPTIVTTDYQILPAPPSGNADWPEPTLEVLAAAQDAGRVALDDARIVAWATEVVHYAPGDRVDLLWQDEQLALGTAGLDPYDVLSLGEGGEAILAFEAPIRDGDGADLAVFENAVPDNFVEFGRVAVSTDGIHFATFDVASLAPGPVGTYDVMDARLVDGLAGSAPIGFGVAFDLAGLRGHPLVLSGFVDLETIHFVRVSDLVGDGATLDSFGRPIWDPYPTYGSAGFDIDAVAVLR